MIFSIEPHLGAKPITFGMNKCDVHKILGAPQNTFRRNTFSKGDTEAYDECFVEYDANDNCVAIEFFDSACVMLNQTNLFSLSCAELREMLNIDGEDEEFDDCGFTSDSYGISVYAPDEEDDPYCYPESINVYK